MAVRSRRARRRDAFLQTSVVADLLCHAFKMDPKSINFAARRNLGFFLTLKQESEENKNEYKVLDAAARCASDKLREKKVRPANALKTLPELYDIIEEVTDAVQAKAEELGGDVDDFKDRNYATAYGSAVVFAAMSRYANLMDRRKDDDRPSKPKKE